MQKILVIEDDSNFHFLIQEFINEIDGYEVVFLNPNEVPLETILQNIESNNYVFIMLDHNYSRVNYTGKEIADKCVYSGKIYSISGEEDGTEYCDKYIGKSELNTFFKELEPICV